jgi:hypothetical protein
MAPYGARWMYSFLGTSDASKLMHLSPFIAQYRHKAKSADGIVSGAHLKASDRWKSR